MSKPVKWTDEQVKAIMLADPGDAMRVAAEMGMGVNYATMLRSNSGSRRVLRLRRELGLYGKAQTPLLRLIKQVQRELA